MKAGQFSDEQIVATLQEAARGEKTISVTCQEKGISEATFYAWRKKFHGTSTKDVHPAHRAPGGSWRKRMPV